MHVIGEIGVYKLKSILIDPSFTHGTTNAVYKYKLAIRKFFDSGFVQPKLFAPLFTETDAPSGDVLLTLAGDGVIRLTVEALDVTLKDVTRPYVAPSRKLPEHPA